MLSSLFGTRTKKDIAVMVEAGRKHGQWRDVFRRILRNKLGMFSLVILVVILILVIFAGVFTPYSYSKSDVPNKFSYPSAAHIMGTDNMGRDLWTRLIYGGRVSLLVAFSSAILSTVIGIILGSVAGYFGGTTDLVITRIFDVLMSIPGLLLAIAVASALGSGTFNTILAMSISGIPGGARVMRSCVMSIKGNEFVEAAIATGSRQYRVLFRHILPNTIAPLLLNCTMAVGGGIMAVSGLSFIGLGIYPPTPEWGSILNAGRAFIRDFWPITVFPALFITLTMFAFNLFGDALRDALDPRLKN